MSSEFKGILVPVDDSSNSMRALNKALALANLTNSTLTLVHVVSYQKNLKISAIDKKKLSQNADKFLEKFVKYSQKVDITPDKKILFGGTIEELINLMKKRKFDLVVVGRRGTSKHSGYVLGSVSNGLVHQSKVPVLVAS